MRISILVVLSLIVLNPGDGVAQVGFGVPAGSDGIAGFAFEGTDGATGEGFRLGITDRRFAVHLHRAELDDGPAGPDGVQFMRVDVALQLDRLPDAVWVTGGTETVQYETRPILLEYERVRYAIGVATGYEFRIGPFASVIPYIAPSAAFEHEALVDEEDGEDVEIDSDASIRVGGSFGLSLAAGPVLIHSEVRHFFGDDDLGGRNNWPFLSVGLAWIFGRDLDATPAN